MLAKVRLWPVADVALLDADFGLRPQAGVLGRWRGVGL